MQDVFVKVLGRRGRIKDQGLSSFLYVTATNTCLNILRNEKRRPVTGDDEWLVHVASPEDTENRALDRVLLERIFHGQKETTRTMAVLHYRDGMTLEETAEATGFSVSGVRKRLRKLRADAVALEGGNGDER
jgi:RNA polymerase sigma-70 factor (ECF subfamily)